VKLLLDTQCWLWWFAQPERLNEEAISRIADETNELWFSVASIWEMAKLLENGTISSSDLLNALQSLSRRCWIEQQGSFYDLPPVLRQYAISAM